MFGLWNIAIWNLNNFNLRHLTHELFVVWSALCDFILHSNVLRPCLEPQKKSLSDLDSGETNFLSSRFKSNKACYGTHAPMPFRIRTLLRYMSIGFLAFQPSKFEKEE